jgi:Carboxypeptidase regulatory-like domain
MKRSLRSSLALLFAILAVGAIRTFAQQPATKSSASEQANSDRSKQSVCAVAGTVLRASTGEPLKKARVILSSRSADDSAQPFVAISDATGHFAFDPPGRYDMRVDRTGFVPQRYAQDDPDKPGAILTLAAGQKMTDLVFRLQSAGVITGHISDEDGDPAEGVIVTILRRVYSRGAFRSGRSRAARGRTTWASTGFMDCFPGGIMSLQRGAAPYSTTTE